MLAKTYNTAHRNTFQVELHTTTKEILWMNISMKGRSQRRSWAVCVVLGSSWHHVCLMEQRMMNSWESQQCYHYPAIWWITSMFLSTQRSLSRANSCWVTFVQIILETHGRYNCLWITMMKYANSLQECICLLKAGPINIFIWTTGQMYTCNM